MKRSALCAALFLGSAAACSAQQRTTPERTRALLGVIADDSMRGRNTGSPEATKSAAWIAARMKEIGLEPLGDSGFFQRVAMSRDVLPPGARRPPFRVHGSFAALDTIPAERRVSALNVIGVLRGSDAALKNEHVLIDAHYDHLGVGRPVNGDSIYNGADDDGSGVVAVLEIARQMAAGPAPKRTVIFMATIAEEAGVLGGQWYIAHPALPLEQMAANLEIEMIGRPDSLAGGPGKAWLTGYERSTMGDALAKSGIPIVADKRLDQEFFYRSDNIAFAMKGIPAHTLSSFNMHRDYHQPTDDMAHIDFDHMAAVINAAAGAARLLSDGPKPEWKPGGRPAVPSRP